MVARSQATDAGRTTERQKRHLVVYDSSVTVGASSRGRSGAVSKGIMRELRLTYPYIIASDAAEGGPDETQALPRELHAPLLGHAHTRVHGEVRVRVNAGAQVVDLRIGRSSRYICIYIYRCIR